MHLLLDLPHPQPGWEESGLENVGLPLVLRVNVDAVAKTAAECGNLHGTVIRVAGFPVFIAESQGSGFYSPS
jgi:hypothetical protein